MFLLAAFEMLAQQVRGKRADKKIESGIHFLTARLLRKESTLPIYLFTFTNGVALPSNTVLPGFDAIAIAASR